MARNGDEVEDIVEIICTKMFFSDFTIRRPKFTKSDGLEKEAADILIPFGKYLLAFQVKSKIELKNASEKTDIDFSRITKVANEAIAQLKTIQRVIKNKWIDKLTTVKGYEIPFATENFEKIIGIVILDLIGEENFPENERTEFIGNYVFEHNMPIHMLLRNEFEALSSEIDTLPDFIEFLEKRRVLIERDLLFPISSILDFLTLYKTEPDIVDRAISQNIHLIPAEGLWNHYQEAFKDLIERRNKYNEPSYYIDFIIDFLHTSVGFHLPDNGFGKCDLSGQGSTESYLGTIRELASLPRLERRILGERLLRCMKRADKQELSYSLLFDEQEASIMLVLSMTGKRSIRQLRLFQLCAMAYCYLNAKKITGLTTEPFSEKIHSYDVICLKDVRFKDSKKLVEQAKSAFGNPYYPEITEYKGRKDSTT